MKNKLFLFVILIFQIGILAQPTPITPIDGALGVGLINPTFTWTDNDSGPGNYRFQLYKRTGPGTNVLILDDASAAAATGSAGIITYNTVLTLEANAEYYWFVEFPSTSTWYPNTPFPGYIFSTVQVNPVATDGTTFLLDGTGFTANWNSVTSATGYQLDVGTTPGGTDILNNQSVAGTSFAVTGLTAGTTYYYQVRAVNGTGVSGNSNIISVMTLPGAPTLISPSNGIVGTSLTPTLSWHAVSTANLYRVTVTGSGAPAPFTTALTSTVLPALTPGVTYSWSVEASNDGGLTYGLPSATRTFTTNYLISPTNLSAGVSVVPAFDWYDVPGAASYTLEIASDNAFSSIVLTQPVVASDYTLLPSQSLLNGATYYWRVTSNNGVVSGTWAFIVVQPAIPYLTNPLNTGVISGDIIYFAWYVVGYASTNFVLEIDDANDFLTPIQTFSGLTSSQYNWTYSGLTPGSTYYWRVTSKTSGGVIVNYSTVWSFVVPGMPDVYPTYPTSGITVYTTSPTLFYYTGTAYNGAYQIRYGTTSGVYGTTITTSNLYETLAGLTAGSTIYWQVRSYQNPTTFGSWSPEQNFSVYSTTVSPVVPTLSFPTGGVTVYTNPPTLYWYTGYFTGLQYQIRYATNPSVDGAGMLNDISAVNFGSLTTNLFATFSSSLSDGTYYWQVRSYNGSTYSGWSSVESFVINSSNSSISAPIATAPVGGTTIYVLNPTLYYYAVSSSALEYRINYSAWPSTDVNGMLDVGNTTSLWTSSTNYVLSGLTPGVTYYWQVQARIAASPATVSSWSSVESFITAAGAFAVVPQIGSPNFGQPVYSNSAVLSWVIPTPSSSPLKYDLQYSEKADLSNAKTIQNLSVPYYQVTGLKNNQTYYWRVASKNENGTSGYSPTGSFKTAEVTGIESESIPYEFDLAQNYPNPFNPTTLISYSIPKNSFVTLKVFDMLGREVKTLVNNEVVAGKYSVQWKGDDNFGNKVATGVYIYRITANDFIASKKMLLIK